MTDLVDEVRTSFESIQKDDNPITIVSGNDDELAPGFSAMRGHYERTLLAIARRVYRFYAGGTLPTNGDEVLHHTGEEMLAPLIATSLRAFTDGVLIGHQSEQIVRMCLHFKHVEHLFHDDDFRHLSTQMSLGFADDQEVNDFFTDLLRRAASGMAHMCGFAHQEVSPNKVWDIWLMAGTSGVCSSYLAGHRLGNSWRERDVLDGIAIATEEVTDEPAGQDEDGH